MGYSHAPAPKASPKFVYLLNADNTQGSQIPKDAFVVYQGHHGDTGAYYADVILPGCAYTEKTATYVNTEGRAQLTRAAVPPPSGTREDWKIIRALSQVCDATLPYDEIADLRVRMSQVSPSLVEYNQLTQSSPSLVGLGLSQLSKSSAKNSSSSKDPFKLPIQDFYLTDPISRASRTMAKCSEAFTKEQVEETVQEESHAGVYQST
jgi:NADH dehydrogenase (ubiquinone) Fe-S protein 1